MNGGLHRFRDRVDPGLLSEIDAWIGRHPLVRIRSALEARTDEKAFFDALANASKNAFSSVRASSAERIRTKG